MEDYVKAETNLYYKEEKMQILLVIYAVGKFCAYVWDHTVVCPLYSIYCKMLTPENRLLPSEKISYTTFEKFISVIWGPTKFSDEENLWGILNKCSLFILFFIYLLFFFNTIFVVKMNK